MKAIDGYFLIRPEEAELQPGEADKSLFYPVDPKQLPKELASAVWPPKG